MVENAVIMQGGAVLYFSKPGEKEGKIYKTVITVDIPVFIPIPEINNLKIKTNYIDCILSLKHTKEDSKTSGLILQGNTWFEDDRWGRVYRSSVKIIFDHSSNPIQLTNEYPIDRLHDALKVINRIIEIARIVVDKFFLYKVVDADISQYIVTGFGKDGNPIKGASASQSTPGLITVMSQDKTFYHFDKAPEILEILCSGKETPLEKGLIRNAHDYILSENFRSAIIEAQTAMETKIRRVISSGMIRNGKTEDEIERLFENTAFMNLVKDHLPRYTKSNFTESDGVYNDWKNNCYGLRNKVAHEGLYPIKLQAEGAIKAAKNVIEFLEESTL